MSQNRTTPHVPLGMPPLDFSGRATSFFEFWPLWLVYVPVVIWWLLLSVRYRSLTLPLIANPGVPLSGMVGVGKSAVLELAGEQAREWILPWSIYRVTAEQHQIQVENVARQLQLAGLSLPVVGKPDIGCRGAGVKLLQDEDQLLHYLQAFPAGGSIQFQQLSRFAAEAGVFYVRYPGSESGEVTSLTLKYTPYVVGDGRSTLADLIAADPRAGQLQHLYAGRHRQFWQCVIPKDQPYRLVFSASHCRGAVFRDGKDYIMPGLVNTLDQIFNDIPGYYYGRLDIKFQDMKSLSAGEAFEIIEINGASSESINIWDSQTSLDKAVKTLLQQYSTLFRLGNANRKLGHKTPGLMALHRGWKIESRLVKCYPEND